MNFSQTSDDEWKDRRNWNQFTPIADWLGQRIMKQRLLNDHVDLETRKRRLIDDTTTPPKRTNKPLRSIGLSFKRRTLFEHC